MAGKYILKGIGVSGGRVQGKVRIVSHTKSQPSFHEGDILVTRITDPTMVSLMARSGAIVCAIGGMTSHPSISSRELGIPCVVSAKNAMKKLQDGMHVIVDGTTGKIFKA